MPASESAIQSQDCVSGENPPTIRIAETLDDGTSWDIVEGVHEDAGSTGSSSDGGPIKVAFEHGSALGGGRAGSLDREHASSSADSQQLLVEARRARDAAQIPRSHNASIATISFAPDSAGGNELSRVSQAIYKHKGLLQSLWELATTMPGLPQPSSVVHPALIAEAVATPKTQALERRAPYLLISPQCARELAVLCNDAPELLYWGYFAHVTSYQVLLAVVSCWYWSTLGASPYQAAVPGLASAVSFLHGCGVRRYGPVTFAYSWLASMLLAVTALGASFSILATLFVPASQILFGSRFLRVLVASVGVMNASIICDVIVPRADGVQTPLLKIFGWNSFVRVVRFADVMSDLEVSDILLKQVHTGACVWPGSEQRCDLYLLMAILNIVAGILDFTLGLLLLLFHKYLNFELREHRMFNAVVHSASLVLELVMLTLNVYYTFGIATSVQTSQSRAAGFRNDGSQLAFLVISMFLTGVSCYLNIVGAHKLLSSLATLVQGRFSVAREGERPLCELEASRKLGKRDALILHHNSAAVVPYDGGPGACTDAVLAGKRGALSSSAATDAPQLV